MVRKPSHALLAPIVRQFEPRWNGLSQLQMLQIQSDIHDIQQLDRFVLQSVVSWE
jgi:hypothetical protein